MRCLCEKMPYMHCIICLFSIYIKVMIENIYYIFKLSLFSYFAL